MTHLKPIYLDYQATTPLDPRVLAAMMPFLTDDFGNAASTGHHFGTSAAKAVEKARNQIAAHIGGSQFGLVFTAGATEAINLALKGLADHYGNQRKNHLITCLSEHPAVLDCCRWLEDRGFRVTYLPVNREGHLDLQQLSDSIDDQTLAVSLMYANNETGVLHDVTAIGAMAKERGVFFLCDGVQAVGKEPLDVEAMGIDLLSISAHKIYGPKGVGALWVRRKEPRVRLGLQMHGGGHERGFRSGSLNVAGIVGLNHALTLCLDEQDREKRRLLGLRRLFLHSLKKAGIAYQINGDIVKRLAGNLNLHFLDIPAAKLMAATPYLAFARGSACTAAVPAPSRVLIALGLSPKQASESVRIGFGRMTTEADVLRAASDLATAIRHLKTTATNNL